MKSLLQKVLTLGVFLAGVVFLLNAVPAHALTPQKIKADGTRLYNSETGQTFKPRGANYVRLATDAAGIVYHSTFEPGKYNAAAVKTFLSQMQANKYNTVRVFIDPGVADATKPHGIGRGIGTYDAIYGPYMDNFAHFVNEAAVRGIYVLPSIDYFPTNSYYWNLAGANQDGYSTVNVGGQNLSYMDSGRIAAKAEYMKQFSKALIDRVGANENAILAYQSDNEFFYETSQPPFSALSGTVRPANGIMYDMSKLDQRQQAADASMVMYSIRLKDKLLEVNPDALMTIGFFTNQAVRRTSFNGLSTMICSTNCPANTDHYRVPGRPTALSAWGKVDFLDIHLYPEKNPYNLGADLTSIEEAWFKKPYIIGEFGTIKAVYGYNLTTAATAMRDFRVTTCKEGAQGWLFWTWDTYETADQLRFYKMADGNYAIMKQLAPLTQPDPCSTTVARTARKYISPTPIPAKPVRW